MTDLMVAALGFLLFAHWYDTTIRNPVVHMATPYGQPYRAECGKDLRKRYLRAAHDWPGFVTCPECRRTEGYRARSVEVALGPREPQKRNAPL